MKKEYNYDKAESWLRRGFTAAEKKIKYSGSITEEALDPERKKTRVKREKERGGGFFTSPALQVAGAFLAAAIVGGGTFGALKYLEYIGAQRISGQPGDDTSISTGIEPDVTAPDNNNVPAKDYEDLLAEVTKVEYDDEASQGGYAMALTGSRIYGLRAYPYGVTTKKSNDEIAAELFDTAALFDVEIPLSGDFDIVNNVENREMEFLSAEIRKENTQEKTSFNAATGNSIAKIGQYMRNAEPGTYYVSVMVSWDFKPLKEVGDGYRVFTLPFKLIVSDHTESSGVEYDESNSFETAHYIKVTSGGTEYYPYVHILSKSTHQNGESVEIDYDVPAIEDITIPYNDDFRIVSNVVDKYCTVKSISVYNNGITMDSIGYSVSSFAELENALKNGFYDGSVYVQIIASWVNGTNYGIGFTVTKAKENDNRFIDVNEIYLSLSDFTEPLNIDISFPTETKYKNLRMLKNKDLNITVYRYETEDTDKNTYGLFITRGDEFIAELPPVEGCVPPERFIYVRQTPSGDPTVFFTVCKNADNGDKWTTLYALDLVTCQLSYISSVGPHAYNMVSRVIDCGFSYKVDTCVLGLEVIGRPIPDIGADDYYVAPIRYKNGAYLIDPPYPTYEKGKTYRPFEGFDDTGIVNRITVSTKSESYAIKTGSDETVVFDGFLSVSDEDIIEEWVLLDGENKKELLRGNGHEFKKIEDYISVLSIIKQHGFIVEMETTDNVPFRFNIIQGFSLPPDSDTIEPDDTTEPGDQTTDPTSDFSSVLEPVGDEIKDYVAGKMWNGMTWAQLVESLSRLKQLKQDILADNSASRIEEADGTFVKYAGDGVYDFLAFIEKNEEIREARLILYSNAEFDLPFGITPDMTAEQALKKMGFTEEQISEMNGQYKHGDLTLWYSKAGLTVTSGLIDGASFGIELYPEGKTYKNTAYIEFEK